MVLEGPVLIMELVGVDAVKKWREIIGSTDPSQAARGTLRSRFG